MFHQTSAGDLLSSLKKFPAGITGRQLWHPVTACKLLCLVGGSHQVFFIISALNLKACSFNSKIGVVGGVVFLKTWLYLIPEYVLASNITLHIHYVFLLPNSAGMQGGLRDAHTPPKKKNKHKKKTQKTKTTQTNQSTLPPAKVAFQSGNTEVVVWRKDVLKGICKERLVSLPYPSWIKQVVMSWNCNSIFRLGIRCGDRLSSHKNNQNRL